MTGIDSFSISLSYSTLLFILGIIVFAAVTVFVYRITVPKIGRMKKIVLITLRSLALTLILLLIFEPILNLFYSEDFNPSTYIFVDNSKSIINEDSTEHVEQIENIVANFRSKFGNNVEIFSFGDSVRSLNTSNDFNDRFTDYESVMKFIKENRDHISNVVTISDGNINRGNVSIYDAENAGLRFYTIGIGDTLTRKDISIRNVSHNKYLYTDSPTNIEVTILNSELQNESTVLSFYESDELVESKNITINPSGINIVNFNYTVKSEGEKKLTFTILPLPDEFTTRNNSKTVFVQVQKEKVDVSIIADAPSVDLRFLIGALKQNESLNIHSRIQITPGEYFNDPNDETGIDSSDVLILVGFPSNKSTSSMLQNVTKLLRKGVPFLYLLQGNLDIDRSKNSIDQFPFEINNTSNSVVEANTSIENNLSSLLKIKGEVDENEWQRLPPISTFNSSFTAKPGSDIIASVNLRNFNRRSPLIISRSISSQRSIAILGFNLWRWKLQKADENSQLYDQFIQNCIKWLNVDPEKERFSIDIPKRIFALGEPIEIFSELYDESLNPIENAEITITAQSETETINTNLMSEGNGVYSGKLLNLPKGNYLLNAYAELDNVLIAKTSKRVSVEDVDVESLSSNVNKEFLSSLAERTGGKFILANEEINFADELIRENQSKQKKIEHTSEINILSNEYVLFFIIFVFGLEWFLRKRSGMF